MYSDSRLITRQFFRILPIQILLLMVQGFNGIVSSLFASNLVGQSAMSAIGVYGPISMLISSVSQIFMGGSQILCGKYFGKNQIHRIQDIFSLNMLMSVLFSLFVTLLLFLTIIWQWTSAFAIESGVKGPLDEYCYGQLPGILPLVLGSQVFAFLSLENQKKRTTIATIVFTAVNAFCCYLFVYVLKMGTLGVSLAQSAGSWAFLLVQVTYYFTGKSAVKIRYKKPSLSDVKEILKIGYPGALVNGYQTLRGIIVNTLVLMHVGAAGLSAQAAAGSALGILWAIPNGVVAVSRMLMNVAIGEEDRNALTNVMKVAVFKCIPMMAVISVIVVALGDPLTRMYYRNPAEPVFGMTVSAFRLLPLVMPLSMFTMHMTCYAQSNARQALIHVTSAFDGVIGVALFSWILIPVIKMDGLYLANILNSVVCIMLFVGYAVIKKKRFPRNLGELMVIPEDFGVSDDERMDITIRNVEEVTSVSEKVNRFCEERGISPRRSYFAGLFLEEMAGNVVEHGFPKDHKKHSVDVCVVHKEDDIILRVQDDCVPFNPKEAHKIVTEQADPAKNIGIRIVCDTAEEVSYQNILGLNVLTIRI